MHLGCGPVPRRNSPPNSLGVSPLITASLLFVLLLLLCGCCAMVQAKKAHIPGDLILGGLFPIHEKAADSRCGNINKDRGIQRLEAMLFAIDKINHDPNILGGIKLGATILDTCSSDSHALNQSLEFIRASINTVDPHAFVCDDQSVPKPKHAAVSPISGVVGGSYSEVSLQVANLLRLFRIPQVSPASTGTSLSDKTRYDFFARTVPPDTFQALAMVDVVQRFNWSYVSLVSSEGQYGDSGMTAFAREARMRNICIAVNEKVPHSANRYTFDQIIMNLYQKPNARGVVMFTRAEDARGILEAAKRMKIDNDKNENSRRQRFYWIASDGWGTQEKLVEGLEDVAEGAITVELQSRPIDEFDEYMTGLTVETNKRNPWFKEYWESVFMCSVEENANKSRPRCSGNLRLSRSVGYRQETKVQFVVDAVYALAHALNNVHKDVCTKNYTGVCPAMRDLDGGILYKQYLLNVSFKDMVGSMVRFDSQGDGLAPYLIYNYQRTYRNSTRFHYRTVGRWLDQLELNMSGIVWDHTIPSAFVDMVPAYTPISVCSAECALGEVKKLQTGDVCCWICTRCEPWQYVEDEFTCVDCGDGRWPLPDKRSCYDLPLQYMQWNTLYATIPIAIAVFGIILTTAVIIIFIKNNETPIVRASGRELSYMLLSGILVCYLMTFVLLMKPTPVSCAAQRFGVGLGFAIVYSSLLTKTNRISRIFDSARRSARRPSFISPKSQMIITIMLISIQVVATIVWFVVEPPSVRTEHPDGKRSEVILKCRIKDSSFLMSLIFNMMLITTCTVYAIKTRKIPENFNESKFIGFTMYTTCIIWLAFVPIYFGTGNSFQVQITTLCVSISLSAYVALFCLFSPKVYIILFHPDKNVRKLTMNSATYKKAPTSSTTCATGAPPGLPMGPTAQTPASANHGTTTCTTATGTNTEVSSSLDPVKVSSVVQSPTSTTNDSYGVDSNTQAAPPQTIEIEALPL